MNHHSYLNKIRLVLIFGLAGLLVFGLLAASVRADANRPEIRDFDFERNFFDKVTLKVNSFPDGGVFGGNIIQDNKHYWMVAGPKADNTCEAIDFANLVRQERDNSIPDANKVNIQGVEVQASGQGAVMTISNIDNDQEGQHYCVQAQYLLNGQVIDSYLAYTLVAYEPITATYDNQTFRVSAIDGVNVDDSSWQYILSDDGREIECPLADWSQAQALTPNEEGDLVLSVSEEDTGQWYCFRVKTTDSGAYHYLAKPAAKGTVDPNENNDGSTGDDESGSAFAIVALILVIVGIGGLITFFILNNKSKRQR